MDVSINDLKTIINNLTSTNSIRISSLTPIIQKNIINSLESPILKRIIESLEELDLLYHLVDDFIKQRIESFYGFVNDNYEELKDPINEKFLIENPVSLVDGEVYEKKTIEKYFEKLKREGKSFICPNSKIEILTEKNEVNEIQMCINSIAKKRIDRFNERFERELDELIVQIAFKFLSIYSKGKIIQSMEKLFSFQFEFNLKYLEKKELFFSTYISNKKDVILNVRKVIVKRLLLIPNEQRNVEKIVNYLEKGIEPFLNNNINEKIEFYEELYTLTKSEIIVKRLVILYKLSNGLKEREKGVKLIKERLNKFEWLLLYVNFVDKRELVNLVKSENLLQMCKNEDDKSEFVKKCLEIVPNNEYLLTILINSNAGKNLDDVGVDEKQILGFCLKKVKLMNVFDEKLNFLRKEMKTLIKKFKEDGKRNIKSGKDIILIKNFMRDNNKKRSEEVEKIKIVIFKHKTLISQLQSQIDSIKESDKGVDSSRVEAEIQEALLKNESMNDLKIQVEDLKKENISKDQRIDSLEKLVKETTIQNNKTSKLIIEQLKNYGMQIEQLFRFVKGERFRIPVPMHMPPPMQHSPQHMPRPMQHNPLLVQQMQPNQQQIQSMQMRYYPQTMPPPTSNFDKPVQLIPSVSPSAVSHNQKSNIKQSPPKEQSPQKEPTKPRHSAVPKPVTKEMQMEWKQRMKQKNEQRLANKVANTVKKDKNVWKNVKKKSAPPKKQTKSKSFDFNSVDLSNDIFTGHLNKFITAEQIKDFFEEKISKNCVAKISLKEGLGFAYVRFHERKHAIASLALDGELLMEFEIDIYPTPKNKRSKRYVCRIEGILKNMQRREIKQLFKSCGLILNIRNNPGIDCLIDFASQNAAYKCMKYQGMVQGGGSSTLSIELIPN